MIKQAQEILRVFAASGYEAYIVGGAVRDMMLGMSPLDADICTNAIPDEIIAVAQQQGWRTSQVGAAFGSVIVVVAGIGYDVTTFRREEYGVDSHKPEKVEFGADLREDLARRDFTINTLCLDVQGDLLDLFGGLEDLRMGIVCAVGDANVRFSEDGLRMFRAARFVAQLGFVLHKDILPAIIANTHRVRGLSVERVLSELERTLVARYASRGLNILLTTGLLSEVCRDRENTVETQVAILPELAHLYNLPQNPRHHRLDGWRHVLSAVDFAPPTLTLRWAALLHDVAKGLPGVRGRNVNDELTDYQHDIVGTQIAERVLGRLKVDKTVARQVVWLVRNHMRAPLPEHKSVIKWLRKHAEFFRSKAELLAAIEQLFALYAADGKATRNVPNDDSEQLANFMRPLLDTLPFYPADLLISGGEIAAVLGAGKQVGQFQRALLQRIQSGLLENTRAALLAALHNKVRRQKLSEKLQE